MREEGGVLALWLKLKKNPSTVCLWQIEGQVGSSPHPNSFPVTEAGDPALSLNST